jgi:hypothetical protein
LPKNRKMQRNVLNSSLHFFCKRSVLCSSTFLLSTEVWFRLLLPYNPLYYKLGARVATTAATKIIKKLDHTMIFDVSGGDENEMISTFRLHHWIRRYRISLCAYAVCFKKLKIRFFTNFSHTTIVKNHANVLKMC